MTDEDRKSGRAAFERVAGRMIAAHDRVEEGRMMSRAAISYRGKVFAFLGSQDKMVFRLGKDYEPDAVGLVDWSYLSPFKQKPPMRGWVVVQVAQTSLWSGLAEEALAAMRAEIG